MTQAVFFDFDGTLIDTYRLYLEAFRRTLQLQFGRLPSDREILDLQPTAERRLLERVIVGMGLEQSFGSFLEHYAGLHATHCDGLYPGIADMIHGLARMGCRLGVVTGKSRPAWGLTFPECGLPNSDVVVTDDDVCHPKPHPEGLLVAAKALGIPPAEAIYIGDSLLDYHAARAVDMEFAAAAWAKSDEDLGAFQTAVASIAPCRMLMRPSDVISHISDRMRRCTEGAA